MRVESPYALPVGLCPSARRTMASSCKLMTPSSSMSQSMKASLNSKTQRENVRAEGRKVRRKSRSRSRLLLAGRAMRRSLIKGVSLKDINQTNGRHPLLTRHLILRQSAFSLGIGEGRASVEMEGTEKEEEKVISNPMSKHSLLSVKQQQIPPDTGSSVLSIHHSFPRIRSQNIQNPDGINQ